MKAMRSNDIAENKITDESQAGSSSLHRFLLPLVLVLTFVAYSGTLRYEFVYDDLEFIVRNQKITSWTYVPRFFTEHLWSHRDLNRPGNYYRPLFLVWALTNRSLLGLNSTAWHLVTLLAYLAVVTMVYWLTRRLLKDRITAGIAAAVFALYPLHIETAAWICGASEPLLALLFIPSFLFYLRSREAAGNDVDRTAKIKWVILSLALYAAALFAKETAIILPAIIFAYEIICGGDSPDEKTTERKPAQLRLKSLVNNALRAVKCAVPFVAVGAAYLAVRAVVLGSVMYQPIKLPLLTKLLTIPSLLWGYLKLLVWPIGLSEFYDTSYVEKPGFASFLLPLAVVALAIIALVWTLKRVKELRERRILAFACAWIVVPILPVLNIGTFSKGDLIHDRYLFLPTIGVAILIAYGLRRIRRGSGEIYGMPKAQALAVLVLAGALGMATAYQHVHWANDVVLFHHSLSVAPENEIAQTAFGNALSAREMYDEAISVLEGLVQRNPENAMGQYNLGYNYYKAGRYEEAVPHLTTAIDINPTNPSRYLTLGVTLYYLDKCDAAERVLREGIRLRSRERGLHYALGAVLEQTGRLQDALDEFRQELAYNPDYLSAHDQIDQINKKIEAGGASESASNR